MPPLRPAWTRLRAPALLAALCLMHGALAVRSLPATASTYDEAVHLSAGYSYWTLGDWRMNPEHPPLLKLIAALPLVVAGARLDGADPSFRDWNEWELGRLFLFSWNDADRVLTLARLPVIGLSMALCASVFLWARRHWGEPVAWTAAALSAFDPNLLAHGRLVTTDVAATLFVFLSVAALGRFVERPGAFRLALAGLAVGAAVATKFSALVLGPIAALLLVLALRPLRPRILLASLAGVAACTVAVLWTVYGFRNGLTGGGTLPWDLVLPPGGLVRSGVDWTRRSHLLPEPFVFGFVLVRNMTALKPSFLMGQASLLGWWYYFPVVLLVKTPLPLLLLIVLGAASVARHRAWRREELFLLLPPIVYLAFVFLSSFDIGFRHLLPAFPFLWILAARGAALAWPPADAAAPAERRGRVALRACVLALVGWQVVGTLRIHPHYLAFFNELAGGPEQGSRILVDSNLDWGQDLPGLRAYMDEHGIPLVKLSYFGTADPDYYGVRHEWLPSAPGNWGRERWVGVRPGDWLAVSATNLRGIYLTPASAPLLALVRRLQPVASVGHSIFLYRADFTWDPTTAR